MQEIPSEIADFLTQPLIIHVGTHNEKLHPWEVIGFGIKVADDKQSVTVYLPEKIAGNTLANLQATGKIATTVVYPPTHESYQLKGAYLGHQGSSSEEMTYQDDFLKNLNATMELIGLAPGFFSSVNYKPSIAVTFKVTDIFRQTPGPEAGKKIS